MIFSKTKNIKKYCFFPFDIKVLIRLLGYCEYIYDHCKYSGTEYVRCFRFKRFISFGNIVTSARMFIIL